MILQRFSLVLWAGFQFLNSIVRSTKDFKSNLHFFFLLTYMFLVSHLRNPCLMQGHKVTHMFSCNFRVLGLGPYLSFKPHRKGKKFKKIYFTFSKLPK